MKSPTELQQHARDLAVAFNVRLVETDQLKPEEALALPHLRVVLTAPVFEEATYIVVLHEIGHLASPTGSVRSVVVGGNRRNLMLEEETAAWAWARHYALEWSPLMETLSAWAMSTYTGAALPPPVPPSNQSTTTPSKPAINWKEWA